jgi:UDP-N-acetylmuramoylalanine--D-glutamate ligase
LHCFGWNHRRILSGMDFNLSGALVAVIGLGRTGVAVAQVLSRRGARVVVYDTKPEQELAEEIQTISHPLVEVIVGRDDFPGIERADVVVPSPGVPADAPVLVSARERGVLVMPEIELAYHISRAPIVAVTGTNGKTTTTALIGAMLCASGVKARVGGNMAPGEPLILLADAAAQDEVLVAEVSSFQLETCTKFRPRAAVLTNISQDHLNRHGSMDAYASAKARLFQAQTEDDLAVLNADCPVSRTLEGACRAKIAWFSLQQRFSPGAYLDGDRLVADLGEPVDLISVGEIRLIGWHNQEALMNKQELIKRRGFLVENALAASLAALFMGASAFGIAEALRNFKGVPHRMEPVCEIGGVLFINNSMCTNPQALVRSVESCSRPVVLIAGGRNKRLDFTQAAARVASLVKGAVLIGEMADELRRLLRENGLDAVETARTMDEAVKLAVEMAVPGDVVMLAPGCASMDMYSDFMERGEAFKRAVERLGSCTGEGVK